MLTCLAVIIMGHVFWSFESLAWSVYEFVGFTGSEYLEFRLFRLAGALIMVATNIAVCLFFVGTYLRFSSQDKEKALALLEGDGSARNTPPTDSRSR